jgi:hypothetical protein
MQQMRKKIILNVMMPFVVALIVLGTVMTRPTMEGIRTVNVSMLLLTGSLFGIAVAQTISVLRKNR